MTINRNRVLSRNVIVPLVLWVSVSLVQTPWRNSNIRLLREEGSLAADIAPSPQTSPNVTRWCVISQETVPWQWNGKTKKWIHHFPHFAEILLPCWSHFQTHSEDHCGLLLLDSIELGDEGTWHHQLVNKLSCQVQFANTSVVPDNDEKNDFYAPTIRQLRPRFQYARYLQRPEHAHALRDLVLANDTQLPPVNKTHPRIGILQRPKTRRLLRLEELEEALRVAFPNANVSSTNFTSNQIEDQAWWWATQDVVVTPHGAALLNSVFIREGTIVLQMHPGDFYYTMYDCLIEQSGGTAVDWYHHKPETTPKRRGKLGKFRWKNPHAEHYELMKQPRLKNQQHHSPIDDYGANEIVDLIRSSLGLAVTNTSSVVYRTQFW